MMNDHFREALLNLDVHVLRRMWSYLAPNMPQPKTDQECLATAHIARTAMQSIPLKARAYSYRWLVERGYPTQLPDNLKPEAERMYPTFVEAVAISCKSTNKALQPVFDLVRGAMEDVVKDAYAGSKRVDADRLKAAMMETRQKTIKKLLAK